MKNTVKSRRVAILVAEGFDHAQLSPVKSALEDAGAHTKIASKNEGSLKSADGREVEMDKRYVTTGSMMFDAVFVPGGQRSAEALKSHGDALHFVNEAFRHCKPIAANGEGVDLLLAADLKGLSLAGQCAPGHLGVEQGVVTSRAPSDTNAFARKFIEAIAQQRHWHREMLEQVTA